MNSLSPTSKSKAATSMAMIGKENQRQPCSNDATNDEPSKTRKNKKGLVRNNGVSEKSADSGCGGGGIRLSYFDENNVMDGTVDDANGQNNQYPIQECGDGGVNGSQQGQGQWNEDDDDDDFEEEEFLPNQLQDNGNNSSDYSSNVNDGSDNNANDNDNSYEEEEEEDDDLDDTFSDASGDTVVQNDCPLPPVNATMEELNRHYWEWCYGPNFKKKVNHGSYSVMKSAPAKSCLSTNKKRNNVLSNNTSITPRRILHHSPDNDTQQNNNMMNNLQDPHQHLSTPTDMDEIEDSTPKNNITRLNVPKPPAQSAVKFGNNCAAEFDFLQPITEMTPIPSCVVQKIFPSDMKETEKEIEEQGVSRETAKNVATLAAWDSDFDDIISEDFDEDIEGDDDDEDGGDRPRRKRGRKHTPYKRAPGRRGSSGRGLSRPRKSRRDSSLFSRERRSLIDEDELNNSTDLEDDDNDGSARGRRGNLLPFSVTIDPEEYTSPSSSSMSVSTLGTPAGVAGTCNSNASNRNMRDSLDSTTSACISPSSSSLRPDCNSTVMDAGLENKQRGDSNNGRERTGSRSSITTTTATGRETPNSARTSSSTILRAVHASGASLLPSHSPSQGSGVEPSTGNMEETPNSARTSSSTILRAVHASGASLLPSHSPPQGSGVETSSGNMSGGDGGGGLKPNQLKYSPSSSSGCSSADTLRMDLSPSSAESLGSDIMTLFTDQSLDDDSEDSSTDICKQLSSFSTHPTQPFHTSIHDLIMWMEHSRKKDDPAAFIYEHLLKGLSPFTSLSLIAHDEINNSNKIESMYGGTSAWLQSALFECNGKKESESAVLFSKKRFENILLGEIKELISRPSPSPSSRTLQDRMAMMSDGDLETVLSCIQQLHRSSSLDWSSMELDAAIRSSSRLQEFAEKTEEENGECHKFVTSCCKKLLDTSSLTMRALEKSNDTSAMTTSSKKKMQLRKRKRKVQSQIEEEHDQVKSLEDQLALEVNRLNGAKLAKQLFDTRLEVERAKPISGLSEEVRAFISPVSTFKSPVTGEPRFTFKMLDDSVEIVIGVPPELENNDYDEEETTSSVETRMELGCFIRDDGMAIKLLQAILLGTIDNKLDEPRGPYTLRESLSRAIIQDESDRGLDPRDESFKTMTHLFSRIDNLVRSVRELETNGFCTVNASSDGDVTLSISMHHEGVVIRIGFLFGNLLGADWQVTTVPDDVNVSIISSERDLSSLGSQLQEQAQSTLAVISSSSDPILLRRICDKMMESYSQTAGG